MNHTAFAVAAAGLALVTLAYVLQPLWRGQRVIALTLAALLVAGTAGLYLWVGTPAALDPAARKSPETIQEAIVQLEAALERSPDQPEGWQLLARQYVRIGERDKALAAYRRAVELDGDDADLLAEVAESRALLDPGRRFDAEAASLLERALTIDPNHERARLFTGVMQRQAGNSADAAAIWESLLPGLEGDAANALRAQINDARADAGLAPLPAPEQPPAGSHAIPVRVALSPALDATELPADTTVFVIARLADGAPMPVAVQRHTLAQLPLQVTLDDADSPMPTARLSAIPEVEVLARISPSGDASRQADDIESAPVRVRLPATGTIDLLLDARR
ncbi:MAG: tetratricopeptide repeat protein [Pseudoxanthomonas suwonensis]|nr:tetratricopeptide repeat protein [Pseudoxanthomonas suwonensis]